MGYKFQELQAYKISLAYLDLIYSLAQKLPETEKFNLKPQVQKAATSIILNIAEGSTGQSDAEANARKGFRKPTFYEITGIQKSNTNLIQLNQMIRNKEREKTSVFGPRSSISGLLMK